MTTRDPLTARGEREYFIRQGFMGMDAPLKVVLPDPPPCLFCDQPVLSPSTDGPLVCPTCDCGWNADGSAWTREQSNERHAHFRKKVAEYRARSFGPTLDPTSSDGED